MSHHELAHHGRGVAGSVMGGLVVAHGCPSGLFEDGVFPTGQTYRTGQEAKLFKADRPYV